MCRKNPSEAPPIAAATSATRGWPVYVAMMARVIAEIAAGYREGRDLTTWLANSGRKAGQVLTFRVDKKANKIDIKGAVEEIFNVKVANVRTVQYEGKVKRRGRVEGRKASFKKAYVTLRKGEPMVDYAEAI